MVLSTRAACLSVSCRPAPNTCAQMRRWYAPRSQRSSFIGSMSMSQNGWCITIMTTQKRGGHGQSMPERPVGTRACPQQRRDESIASKRIHPTASHVPVKKMRWPEGPTVSQPLRTTGRVIAPATRCTRAVKHIHANMSAVWSSVSPGRPSPARVKPSSVKRAFCRRSVAWPHEAPSGSCRSRGRVNR